MDTFMDKLAEKRNTQNPSASSALKNIPKNSEFRSIQQTNMKRQQIQQSFLNEAFIMDQINTLKELQENKKEEIKHCDAFLFEMVANIIDRNMATRDGFQKGK